MISTEFPRTYLWFGSYLALLNLFLSFKQYIQSNLFPIPLIPYIEISPLKHLGYFLVDSELFKSGNIFLIFPVTYTVPGTLQTLRNAYLMWPLITGALHFYCWIDFLFSYIILVLTLLCFKIYLPSSNVGQCVWTFSAWEPEARSYKRGPNGRLTQFWDD